MDTSPCSASHWLVIPVGVANVRERRGTRRCALCRNESGTPPCALSRNESGAPPCAPTTPLGSPCAALLPRRIGIHGKTSPPQYAPKHCLPRFRLEHCLPAQGLKLIHYRLRFTFPMRYECGQSCQARSLHLPPPAFVASFARSDIATTSYSSPARACRLSEHGCRASRRAGSCMRSPEIPATLLFGWE